MNLATLPLWPEDVRQLGDQIVALSPAQAAELGDYLREVHKIDSPGGHPTILNCGAAADRPAVRFSFRCPKSWESLRPQGQRSVRFCDGCSQSVHFCRTAEEAWGHAALGHCIAVPARLAGAVSEPSVMGAPLYDPTEKDSFAVSLDGGDPIKKISVIKALRDITGLGLKEVRDLVELSPRTIKEGLARDEADAIRKKLEEAGGKVSLK